MESTSLKPKLTVPSNSVTSILLETWVAEFATFNSRRIASSMTVTTSSLETMCSGSWSRTDVIETVNGQREQRGATFFNGKGNMFQQKSIPTLHSALVVTRLDGEWSNTKTVHQFHNLHWQYENWKSWINACEISMASVVACSSCQICQNAFHWWFGCGLNCGKQKLLNQWLQLLHASTVKVVRVHFAIQMTMNLHLWWLGCGLNCGKQKLPNKQIWPICFMATCLSNVLNHKLRAGIYQDSRW